MYCVRLSRVTRPLPATRNPKHLARILPQICVALIDCRLGWGLAAADAAEPLHGLAMHGQPKHAPGFTQLPYVNRRRAQRRPACARGARHLRQSQPVHYRGVAPSGLREYVFESLMTRSGDEPFTLYGLIAETVELPPDRAWITFHLRPEARFADGQPITPEDVLFSHAVLRDKGWPYHRSHYGKVAKAEKVGERSVRFTFEAAGDREVPLLLGLMPILPRHRLDADTFERTTLEPPLGSGPYTVARVDAGRSITYRRNPDWWARDLPDHARALQLRRDPHRVLPRCRDHVRGLQGRRDRRAAGGRSGALDRGLQLRGRHRRTRRQARVRHRAAVGHVGAGVQYARGRRFKDPRVRRAFILLFDAEWMNRNLFNGLFKRTQSYFERSYLSSHGRPADARERALLAPFSDLVKPEVLDGTYKLPVTDGSGDDRANLRQPTSCSPKPATRSKGGRMMKGRHATQHRVPRPDARAGAPAAQLSRARSTGSASSSRCVRSTARSTASRLKSFDFDMVQWTWTASLSPGNEQINRWSSKAADIEGSLNLAGVKNPAADAMIEALLQG